MAAGGSDVKSRRRDRSESVRSESRTEPSDVATPKFMESSYQAQAQRINTLLDQYRLAPDYYGTPWQLRRTFEPIHAERVSNWFFYPGWAWGAQKRWGRGYRIF